MKVRSTETANDQPYEAALLNRRWLSDRTFEIELTRPAAFSFKPGQRLRFIHETIERDYSLISAPSDPALALCVRKVEEGVLSPIFASARVGTRFSFTGPYGYFTFQPSPRPVVFVATGTGIAPFVSMGRSGVRGFILLHGVRKPSELYYGSFFKSTANIYVPCLSRASAESPAVPDAFHGKVTAYLEKYLSPGSYDFYLCGRREMIRDVILLVDGRFPGSLVHTEIFY